MCILRMKIASEMPPGWYKAPGSCTRPKYQIMTIGVTRSVRLGLLVIVFIFAIRENDK